MKKVCCLMQIYQRCNRNETFVPRLRGRSFRSHQKNIFPRRNRLQSLRHHRQPGHSRRGLMTDVVKDSVSIVVVDKSSNKGVDVCLNKIHVLWGDHLPSTSSWSTTDLKETKNKEKNLLENLTKTVLQASNTHNSLIYSYNIMKVGVGKTIPPNPD
jgi:hypothetical protein